VFNVGEQHGIRPGDLVGVIAGVTRLGKEVIGAIHILPRQSLVDVAEEHESAVRERLSGIRFKGRKLNVDLGREASAP
jgi:ATP-dependent RNA helicase DeaD